MTKTSATEIVMSLFFSLFCGWNANTRVLGLPIANTPGAKMNQIRCNNGSFSHFIHSERHPYILVVIFTTCNDDDQLRLAPILVKIIGST